MSIIQIMVKLFLVAYAPGVILRERIRPKNHFKGANEILQNDAV
jgi:hypothetical protein